MGEKAIKRYKVPSCTVYLSSRVTVCACECECVSVCTQERESRQLYPRQVSLLRRVRNIYCAAAEDTVDPQKSYCVPTAKQYSLAEL